MNTFVLLFSCRDKMGIVARVSDFILRHQGNIINADQHSTDPQAGHFFMRVEFVTQQSHTELELDLSAMAGELAAQYRLCDKAKRLRMGIFVSRPDHCLLELLYLCRSGELNSDISFVAGNYSGHKELAAQYNVPFHFIPSTKHERKEEELLKLAKESSDFLVLARYMLVLSGGFLKSYAKDIINIHHGFLPSFKGADPYGEALAKGVKVIGATSHFVSEELDDGPIISQMVERVSHRDDLKSLMRKGRNLEKLALAGAVADYLDYRIMLYGNSTIVF